MYETPSPTHGYLPVVVAFWVYVGLAVAVVFGARALGVPDGLLGYLFVLTALLLLKPFLPVFRRLHPGPVHDE